MATKDYLEQLNKALPTRNGYGSITPDANSLHLLALQALVRDETPPLGDDSTPTVKVVASTDLVSVMGSRFGSFIWVEKEKGGWGSEDHYSDITTLARSFLRHIGEEPASTTTETDSRETHVLAVWIPKFRSRNSSWRVHYPKVPS